MVATVYPLKCNFRADDPPQTPIGIGRNVGFYLAVLSHWYDKRRKHQVCILHVPSRLAVCWVQGIDAAREIAKDIQEIVDPEALASDDGNRVVEAFPGDWLEYYECQKKKLFRPVETYSQWKAKQK